MRTALALSKLIEGRKNTHPTARLQVGTTVSVSSILISVNQTVCEGTAATTGFSITGLWLTSGPFRRLCSVASGLYHKRRPFWIESNGGQVPSGCWTSAGLSLCARHGTRQRRRAGWHQGKVEEEPCKLPSPCKQKNAYGPLGHPRGTMFLKSVLTCDRCSSKRLCTSVHGC